MYYIVGSPPAHPILFFLKNSLFLCYYYYYGLPYTNDGIPKVGDRGSFEAEKGRKWHLRAGTTEIDLNVFVDLLPFFLLASNNLPFWHTPLCKIGCRYRWRKEHDAKMQNIRVSNNVDPSRCTLSCREAMLNNLHVSIPFIKGKKETRK